VRIGILVGFVHQLGVGAGRGSDEVKPFRERNPILVGVISVAVLVAAMLFALSLNRLTFLRGVYTVKADFADASGLTPDNEVRVAGLKVGKVDSVELAPARHGFSARSSSISHRRGHRPMSPPADSSRSTARTSRSRSMK
jgi:hypothetical protein